MHCTKCGAELTPNAKFCVTCGATVELAAPEQSEAPAVAAEPEKNESSKIEVDAVKNQLIETLKPVTNFFKNIWANKKLRLGIIIGVALILVVGIVGQVLELTGYKSALNNYVDVMNGDAKKIEKMMPAEYWEYSDDELKKDLDDYIDDFEDMYDDLLDELEDEYGKNVKITYTIEEAKKMDKDDVEDLAEALADQYSFIDDDDVKEAYEVEAEITIKGNEDDDSNDMEVLSVKIGSGWYLISVYEYGDIEYYSFLIGNLF